ncbi:MAG: acetate--CoA ligase family protein [Magnetococcales bacterium]|nr:acetate--CoA ligase family protein [Magnetococcales bacterium]
MTHSTEQLSSLLAPRSIAIVGASRHAGKWGHRLLANVVSGGFAGSIYPVNPHGGAILGQAVYSELAAVPRGVELVLLLLPVAQIWQQAKMAVARGIAALVVLTEGFDDHTQEGLERAAALAKLCRERNVLLLGPNSLGIVHRQWALNGSLAPVMPPVGGLSLFSQSGAVCAAALDWMVSRQLGIAKMVSLGKQASITELHCLSYLAHDPDTSLIACHLTGISEGSNFLKAAMEAAHNKPVVLLLGDEGSNGCNAPSAHSASRLRESPAVRAAIRDRTGIILTTDFQAWMDILLLLARSPLPGNNRVTAITNGNPGLLTATLLERHGLHLQHPAEPMAATVRSQLASVCLPNAPLDLRTVAQPEHYRLAVDALRHDTWTDAIVVLIFPHFLTHPAETVHALATAAAGGKPLLVIVMGGDRAQPVMAELDRLGLAAFATPERAVMALASLYQYGCWRRRTPRVILPFVVNQGRVRRLIQRYGALGIQQLSDLESKQIVQAYGVALPDGEEAASIDEALEKAERMGYPVALHLLLHERLPGHSVESRPVHVAGPQAMRDGFELLMFRFASRLPDAQWAGLFVEKIFSRGYPVSLGMQRDPLFGPLLHIDDGPSFSREAISCQLAPVTSEEAMALLRLHCRQRSGYPLGETLEDNELQGAAELLQRIAQLALDFPAIDRIGITPLLVRRAGLPPVVSTCDIQLSQQERV